MMGSLRILGQRHAGLSTVARTLLDIFDVSLDFLTQVVVGNPSLRGMVLGYLAEAKLKEILEGHGRASAFRKEDDHDRKKKGDLVVTYQGFEFKVEVKSLQTNSVEILEEEHSTASEQKWIRKILKKKGRGEANPEYIPVWNKHRLDGRYRGQFQCDASDKRRSSSRTEALCKRRIFSSASSTSSRPACSHSERNGTSVSP